LYYNIYMYTYQDLDKYFSSSIMSTRFLHKHYVTAMGVFFSLGNGAIEDNANKNAH
jgi:hypothetical protein